MIVTSKPESGQRESLGARSQLVRLTLQVAIVMFTWVFRLMIKIMDVVKLIRLCEEDFEADADQIPDSHCISRSR